MVSGEGNRTVQQGLMQNATEGEQGRKIIKAFTERFGA